MVGTTSPLPTSRRSAAWPIPSTTTAGRRSCSTLPYSYRETGDYEAAIKAGTASLALYRATTFDLGTASLENDLALSFLALGNLARADEFATSSQARFEKLGDRRWLAHVLETQGADRAGRAATRPPPGTWRRTALALAEETHNEKATVSSLLALARANRALGDPAAAAALYERAVDLARESGATGLDPRRDRGVGRHPDRGRPARAGGRPLARGSPSRLRPRLRHSR